MNSADTIQMVIILAETIQMIIIWAEKPFKWLLFGQRNHSNDYYLGAALSRSDSLIEPFESLFFGIK